MKNLMYYLVSFGLSLSPYLLASWGYLEISGEKQNSFWVVFGILIAVRATFAFVEFSIGVVKWRLFGKKFFVQVILNVLKSNKFPMRDERYSRFSNYLYSITEDYVPEPSSGRAAKELQDLMLFLDEFTGWGIWSWRLSSAGEEAFEIYSPSERG